MFALASKAKVAAYFLLILLFLEYPFLAVIQIFITEPRRPITDHGFCCVWWCQRQRGVVFTSAILVNVILLVLLAKL